MHDQRKLLQLKRLLGDLKTRLSNPLQEGHGLSAIVAMADEIESLRVETDIPNAILIVESRDDIENHYTVSYGSWVRRPSSYQLSSPKHLKCDIHLSLGHYDKAASDAIDRAYERGEYVSTEGESFPEQDPTYQRAESERLRVFREYDSSMEFFTKYVDAVLAQLDDLLDDKGGPYLDLEFDLTILRRNGIEIQIGPREFHLVLVLHSARRQGLSRAELTKLVIGTKNANNLDQLKKTVNPKLSKLGLTLDFLERGRWVICEKL